MAEVKCSIALMLAGDFQTIFVMRMYHFRWTHENEPADAKEGRSTGTEAWMWKANEWFCIEDLWSWKLCVGN